MEPSSEVARATPWNEGSWSPAGTVQADSDGAASWLGRRSFLHLGVGGLALGGVLSRGGGTTGNTGGSHGGQTRRTEVVVRRLFDVIQTRDTAAIWAMFAEGGVIDFPFLGLRIADLATLDATIGPLIAVLDGLTYFDFAFEPLGDPHGVIVTHKGHAVISFNGKSYDQTYINEVHVRGDQITRYVEYFDTAVLNAALAP